MHIEKITYSGVMPIASYGVNDRMDVSVVIKEGEDSKQAAHFADQFITEFFKEKYPTLKRPSGTFERETTGTYSHSPDAPQITQVSKLTVFDEIAKCNTLEELKGWELFANSSKSEDVKLAYLNKLKQLTNEPK